MPNLSPVAVREKYKLYDNKICTGDEAAECRFCMQKRMESIGYQVAVNRGIFSHKKAEWKVSAICETERADIR